MGADYDTEYSKSKADDDNDGEADGWSFKYIQKTYVVLAELTFVVRCSRREVLHIISAASLPVVSGCGNNGDDTPTQSGNTITTVESINTETDAEGAVNEPTLTDCEPSELPQSSQTQGGLQPKSYPEYPNSFEKDDLKDYAISFENSYRNNKFLANYPQEYDELTIQSGIEKISETEQGYQMRIEGILLFSDEKQPTKSTATPYPSGRIPFVTWFYFDEDFVLRDGRDTGYTKSLEPDFKYAEAIVCP